LENVETKITETDAFVKFSYFGFSVDVVCELLLGQNLSANFVPPTPSIKPIIPETLARIRSSFLRWKNDVISECLTSLIIEWRRKLRHLLQTKDNTRQSIE